MELHIPISYSSNIYTENETSEYNDYANLFQIKDCSCLQRIV